MAAVKVKVNIEVPGDFQAGIFQRGKGVISGKEFGPGLFVAAEG